MDPGPPKLQRRNVELFDSDGAVIAGIWQYGTLQWDEFYRYIIALTVTVTTWTIFQYDLAQQKHGAPCPSGPQIVQPGHYILLSNTGGPVRVGLVPTLPRPRNSTHSNTPICEPHYRTRGLIRDGKCLITGLQTQTYSRLKVAHIFPRTHGVEWIRKGYPSKITDTADEAAIGGRKKIDSVQNVITMRRDLHDAWVNYEFGVDPNNNYRITAFTNGNVDINGLSLQLDHIQDPTLRPLDELFTDQKIMTMRLAMAPICQTTGFGGPGKGRSDLNLHSRIGCLIIGSCSSKCNRGHHVTAGACQFDGSIQPTNLTARYSFQMMLDTAVTSRGSDNNGAEERETVLILQGPAARAAGLVIVEPMEREVVVGEKRSWSSRVGCWPAVGT